MQDLGQRRLIQCAALVFAMAISCGQLKADETTPPEYAAGHGSVGIEFQDSYDHGDFDGPAGKDSGNVRFLSYQLQASYLVADGWEVHLGLPYIESMFSDKLPGGMFAHPILSCLTPAGPTPACRPTLLDDGSYHGTFQDWDAGVRYHFDYNGVQVAPEIDLIVPSHNYAYYGTSIGERNTEFGLGVELSHQFDFTNFFWHAHAEYFFNTPHIGYDNDYYTLGLDVGYFFSPRLSAKLLTDLRLGNGITDQEIGGPPALNPIWLNHDRIRLQEHGLGGGAIDYEFARDWDFQTTLMHAVWGRSNGDLKYSLDLRLTRSF